MKLNINNRTDLSNEIIGKAFDKWIEKGEDRQVTIFDGMKEYELFEHQKKEYKMTIEHKLTCLSILVEESNILAKEVSMKDVKFPRIPKKKGSK